MTMPPKPTPKLTVVQDPAAPIERNVLAKAIIEISQAVRVLERGGLTHEAVVILTHHAIPAKHKTTQRDVRLVLKSLAELAKDFTVTTK